MFQYPSRLIIAALLLATSGCTSGYQATSGCASRYQLVEVHFISDVDHPDRTEPHPILLDTQTGRTWRTTNRLYPEAWAEIPTSPNR